jgi:GNAT superfamily N-acetyltransferase
VGGRALFVRKARAAGYSLSDSAADEARGTIMGGRLELEQVAEPLRSREFIELPWVVNKGDPDWVPPLRMNLAKLLDRRKYPFFGHGDAEFFLARRGREAVGRIAAIENRLHAANYRDGLAFFGFFECEQDPEVCRALLRRAAEWAKGRGYTRLMGPMGYSMNDEAPGVLVDGFNGPPVILMTHNPRYYGPLLEGAGLRKGKDLYAYLVTRSTMAGERFQRVMNAVRRRAPELDLRPVRRWGRGFRDDVATLLDVFNQAWSSNWGFTPVTPAEVDAIARDLQPIMRPEITGIAEFDGRPVGMLVCIPNINEVMRTIRNGRLLPTGWYKLLKAVRGGTRIHGMRTMLMGVVPEFRGRGVDATLIDRAMQNGAAIGYEYCELSWVLEDNEPMNSLAEKVGAWRYRTYRVYEADIDDLLR